MRRPSLIHRTASQPASVGVWGTVVETAAGMGRWHTSHRYQTLRPRSEDQDRTWPDSEVARVQRGSGEPRIAGGLPDSAERLVSCRDALWTAAWGGNVIREAPAPGGHDDATSMDRYAPEMNTHAHLAAQEDPDAT